ncbi:hypothetical protein ABZS68_11705, partial [Streptomyces sp. NPDC005571]|uniref:hypothetical protein n=1 Tax=Streptomyces sp. NPDC005571 TaxID=3156888 RepID=UPI00339EE524
MEALVGEFVGRDIVPQVAGLAPRTPLGIHPACSALGVRKWVGVADKLLEHSLLFTNSLFTNSLYATLYTVPWLRLLGARVGRSAEASTVSDIDPDLLTPGSPAECVFSVGRRPCHSPRRNWAPAFNASRHAAAQHQARFFSRVGDWRGGFRPVSSPRRFKPCVRFSRTRLS